jgi:hypothetical protein
MCMFQINETRLIGGTCYYYVEIKTSCSSPANMTDKIPIRIGDADNNEVILCTTYEN